MKIYVKNASTLDVISVATQKRLYTGVSAHDQRRNNTILIVNTQDKQHYSGVLLRYWTYMTNIAEQSSHIFKITVNSL